MAIGVIYDTPGVTKEQYDQVAERVRKRVSMPVAGQLVHASGPIEGGWRTVDVWESQEVADRFFQDHLAAAFAEAGLMPSAQPQVFPIHDIYTTSTSRG